MQRKKNKSTIRQRNKVYNDGLKQLEITNIDFEKEMNRRTDYLYVVTSVCANGNPCSPVLHGIYTTCQKAQNAARRSFEKVSDTYRNGVFTVPHNNDLFSKCDLSEFLVPAKLTTTCRTFYEVFPEDTNDMCPYYTAVAVSTIQMVDGKASGWDCSLPFLSGRFSSQLFDPKHVQNSGDKARSSEQNIKSKKKESEITKVYAIFDYFPGNMGDEGAVDMRGVYSNQDDAYTTALRVADLRNVNEAEKQKQIEAAKGKRRGMLYNDPEDDTYWAVGMESVVLDEHLDEMVELTNSSGVWMCPGLSWK
mmetsp:Transcript_30881/g.34578  ORF Transcript_30881/g.34578 Transcript_30881/m.34578 type:complete len:306 (-) Transcript_30881:138-1055(-)